MGPSGFERSYTLAGSAGEHQRLVIANVLQRFCRRGWGGGEGMPLLFALQIADLPYKCVTPASPSDARIYQIAENK
jgi:hypothetical protein